MIYDKKSYSVSWISQRDVADTESSVRYSVGVESIKGVMFERRESGLRYDKDLYVDRKYGGTKLNTKRIVLLEGENRNMIT